MIPVIGYLRCSGLVKSENDGFPRQCAAIQAFCDSKGYELQAVYFEDGISGKIDPTKEARQDDRPAFQALISAMLTNCCRHIVVENLSRLAREYRVQENMLFYLVGKGINLLSADTGENVTEAILGDPMKKAIIQMQGVFFELERSMIIHKLQSGRRRKALATGKCCGGPGRFGEKPEEMLVIQQIREMKSRGESIATIVRKLNEEKAPTRIVGSRWHRTSVVRVLERG